MATNFALLFFRIDQCLVGMSSVKTPEPGRAARPTKARYVVLPLKEPQPFLEVDFFRQYFFSFLMATSSESIFSSFMDIDFWSLLLTIPLRFFEMAARRNSVARKYWTIISSMQADFSSSAIMLN
jgi:hypothetical protein